MPLPAAPNVPIIDYEVSAQATACLPLPPFLPCWFDSPWSHLAMNFDFVIPFRKSIFILLVLCGTGMQINLQALISVEAGGAWVPG